MAFIKLQRDEYPLPILSRLNEHRAGCLVPQVIPLAEINKHLDHVSLVYLCVGTAPRPSPPPVHLILVWINWKHVSTTDKHQRGQATRLLWILELLLFYFSFLTEDKGGLNKHAEHTAAPLPMEGHIPLSIPRRGLQQKEKLFRN